MAVATEIGLDELSMSRVAQEIQVGVTSLYWYFRSKEELLNALTEEAVRVVDEAMPNLSGLAWDEHVVQYWTAYRRILRTQPLLADLTVHRVTNIPGAPQATRLHLTRMNRELTVLIDAGFSPEAALRAYATLAGFTRGTIQTARTFAANTRPDEDPDVLALHLDWSSLATLRDVAPYWTPALATDADFVFGVTAIVAGLRSILLEQGKPAREPKKAAPARKATRSAAKRA
jgi:AcrR family transcriptional regulator